MTTGIVDLPVGSGHEARGIHTIVDLLSWQTDGAGAAAIHQNYVLLLSDRLGVVLAEAGVPALGELIQGLPDSSWLTLLAAPRVSYRLLWPSRHAADKTVRDLTLWAAVERARLAQPAREIEAGAPLPGAEVTWSVLGDGWLDAEGQFMLACPVPGLMPFDIGSPHARSIDLEGQVDEVATPRPAAAPETIVAARARLEEARDAMARHTPRVLDFVNAFTKVLVAQPDHESPTAFSSGSSAQYVGRSVLGNAHLSSVDAGIVADALVHESIHSVMYMSERLEPWVSDPELYGSEARTTSPWTGHALPLRSYLQACFVWYGLLQFWSHCLPVEAFPRARAQERLLQAARGFLAVDVLDQVAPNRPGIVPAILTAIEGIQRDVREAWS